MTQDFILEHGMLRVGSRESELAVVQARHVMSLLQKAHPELHITLSTCKTLGDQALEKDLAKMGAKGVFVKELEDALLKDNIDIAVHSMKDMPGELPVGLAMQSAGQREDVRDAIISKLGSGLMKLPPQAVIGTSSTRRIAQLRRIRPDLDYKIIRGNVQTRYAKLMEARGEYDAIVLAAAGLRRLGWADRISEYLDAENDHIPAAGQGILAVEYRQDDERTAAILSKLVHKPTETAMLAERILLRKLEGGCSLPLGAYAWHDAAMSIYRMKAMLIAPDGTQLITGERSFQANRAKDAGLDLANELLTHGGKEMLKTLR